MNERLPYSLRDAVNEEGDVISFEDYLQLNEEEQDLQQALQERDESYLEELAEMDANTVTRAARPSARVIDLLHDAAIREDELRLYGASSERISVDYGRQFAAQLAHLAVSDKTVELAYPPEKYLADDAEIDKLKLVQNNQATDLPDSVKDYWKQINDGTAEQTELDARERQFKDN